MGDEHIGERAVVVVYADFGDGLEVLHTGDDMAKDGVFFVEMGAGGEGYEEPIVVTRLTELTSRIAQKENSSRKCCN